MKRLVVSAALAFGIIAGGVTSVLAGTHKSLKRTGWITYETKIAYDDLYPRLKKALENSALSQITTASASAGAKGRGVEIPGNRVVGVYNNLYAVRMLEASIAAGIEAPLRIYLTQRSDGGSNFTYKTATEAFKPYFDEGGEPLKTMAAELDDLLDKVAKETVKE